MRIVVVSLLIASLFMPVIFVQNIYAYPSSVGQAVPAKWTYLNFTVCIFSIADPKYEQLFIKAIDEWKSAWPHFTYQLSKSQNCNINVSITKDFVELTNAGHAGVTNTSYYQDGNIVKADIILPTQIKAEVKQGYYCCRSVVLEFPEKTFYVTAMHEFGHALNLAHAVDDNNDPKDVMHPSVSDSIQYVISSVTVKALDKIYGTSTQAKDHPINLKPSVTLDVAINKESYVLDDKLVISGNVSKMGGAGTVLLFDPVVSLYTFTSFSPNPDGTFNVAIDLLTNRSGKWLLGVQYLGASKFFEFNVDDVPYRAYAYAEKSAYVVGDLVKVNGNVTRAGKQVFLIVINPDGISFTSTIAPIVDRKFSAEFALRDSRLTIEGTWTIRAEYADVQIYDDIPTDTHFEVVKSIPSISTPGESTNEIETEMEMEMGTKAQLELRVQAKQIKDLVIMRVRNMDDSTVGVYSFNISTASELTAARGPNQWDKEGDELNAATFSTLNDPIRPGSKQYFLLKVADVKPVIDWEAFGNDINIFTQGSVTPIHR